MAANSIATASSSIDDPVDYRDLKDWIAQQEIHPTPLTPLQQRAIADVKRSMEPNLGDRDWVTLLNLFNKAHGAATKYAEGLTANGGFTVSCALTLAGNSAQLTFPNPAAGFVVVDGAPVAPGFMRKKDAKQYAAKCCIEWLMAGGHMPTDGKSVAFPKTKPTTTAAPAPATAASPTAATTINNTKENDDEPPATARVQDLCARLCIRPPQYKITPAADAATSTGPVTMFDGHADFGPDSLKVPTGLGQVRGVYGRKNARQRVAEDVLAWLEREQKLREEGLERLLAA